VLLVFNRGSGDADVMAKIGALADALEEDDDVSEVHVNAVPT
jgi:transcriptional/translational regulatory protein YebC/TACO1